MRKIADFLLLCKLIAIMQNFLRVACASTYAHMHQRKLSWRIIISLISLSRNPTSIMISMGKYLYSSQFWITPLIEARTSNVTHHRCFPCVWTMTCKASCNRYSTFTVKTVELSIFSSTCMPENEFLIWMISNMSNLS